jgi:hypothetical protein
MPLARISAARVVMARVGDGLMVDTRWESRLLMTELTNLWLGVWLVEFEKGA